MSSRSTSFFGPFGWLFSFVSVLACVTLFLVADEIGAGVVRLRPIPYALAGLAVLCGIAGLVRDESRGIAFFGLLCAVAVTLCLHAGYQGADSFGSEARRRGCQRNRTTIDKVVSSWEVQNSEIPRDQDLEICLSGGGILLECPDSLAGLPAGPGNALKAGSSTFARLMKDPTVFQCPSREKKTWFRKNPLEAECHYRWISGPSARATLGDRDRGAVCRLHAPDGSNTPDGGAPPALPP